MKPYVAVPELASLAGVSRQAIEKAVALTQKAADATWRGVRPIVRTVRGRGGRSGLRYEVRVDSLPVELQRRFNELYSEPAPQLSHGAAAQADREFYYHVISPALGYPKGSRERAQAIREAATQERWRPGEKPFRVSERTIQRKLDAYEAHGLAGLSRAKRADAGSKAVIMTRRWDQAVSLDDAGKHRIASTIRDYVRGLHKAGTTPALIRVYASAKLQSLTASAGYDLGQRAAEICRIPQPFIEAERVYRRVAMLKQRRKEFEDQKPRVLRTLASTPMAVLYGDVHPVDIAVRREDGSVAHARMIAWLDDATRRFRFDLVVLDKSKGIGNRHVIQSFINTVAAWGAPEVLYLDNGSEYGFADMIDDALRLVSGSGQRAIKRALPYNASAKPIEGIFRTLESNYLRAIPGWIGGDRTNKKTANVGNRVDPFPGTLDQFQALVAHAIEMYSWTPQERGKLKGRSPNQAYAEAIKAGWTMTEVHTDAFRLAFSSKRPLTVRQGSISIGGNRWTCPELVRWQERKITALIPKYEDWTRVPLLDSDGVLVGFAERQRSYGPLDPAGAIEAGRVSRDHLNEVIRLARSVPEVDELRERAAFLALQPPTPVAPVGATIGASDDALLMLAGKNETPKAKRERERLERDARVQEQIAAGAAVIERLRRNKR